VELGLPELLYLLVGAKEILAVHLKDIANQVALTAGEQGIKKCAGTEEIALRTRIGNSDYSERFLRAAAAANVKTLKKQVNAAMIVPASRSPMMNAANAKMAVTAHAP
jgi:hypothetical protein